MSEEEISVVEQMNEIKLIKETKVTFQQQMQFPCLKLFLRPFKNRKSVQRRNVVLMLKASTHAVPTNNVLSTVPCHYSMCV